MLIAREKEKKRLETFLESRNKAAMVYGLRRVGKSFLIQNVIGEKGKRQLYFECIEASLALNLQLFCSLFGMGTLPHSTFIDAFAELGRKGEELVVVIDEYQNLKEGEKKIDIDSMMQVAIDMAPPCIKIIICGSYVTAMEKLLERENPLFGRFDPIIKLKGMDYLDASKFFPALPVRQKIEFTSVFGGCPFILDAIDPAQSLEDNVKNIILEPNGRARIYIEFLLFKEIKKVDGVNEVLSLIANGKRSYSQISSALEGKSSGYAAERLAKLEDMGIVKKVVPINDLENRKKTRYEIVDSLIRFYYAYVFRNKSIIMTLGTDAFFASYVEESLNTFISYRFEETVRSYFARLARNGRLPGLMNIGTYSYYDPFRKRNGEFDVALAYKDGYDIFEVKFLERPMGRDLVEAEKAKMLAIENLKLRRIGFVSSSGFMEKDSSSLYIEGDELFDYSLQ